ncbi:nickel-dependent hydrogenase large subunit [Bradyrhizobium sp. UFLA05-112]
MSLAFSNEIDITVWLAGSTIADVTILPRSRPPLARLFTGKQVTSLTGVLPRLFSLCATAHQVAFLSAVEAAYRERPSAETLRRRVTVVVAERLTELLRGLFVGRFALDSRSAAVVRAMMLATTALGGNEEPPRGEAVSQIRAWLNTLGITGEELAPTTGSALAMHLASLKGNSLSLTMIKPSFLSAAEDLDVVTRMLADSPTFSEAPDLHGRIPETGVWARRVMRGACLPRDAGPAERLKARISEIVRLCVWLEGSEKVPENGVIESYRLGNGRGAAAVECARGRLYHAIVLDDEDCIARFEFLAPTEWNFHARGPLVQSLQGSLLAGGRHGQDAVRALVGSFDPCVDFKLEFREVDHA